MTNVDCMINSNNTSNKNRGILEKLHESAIFLNFVKWSLKTCEAFLLIRFKKVYTFIAYKLGNIF